MVVLLFSRATLVRLDSLDTEEMKAQLDQRWDQRHANARACTHRHIHASKGIEDFKLQGKKGETQLWQNPLWVSCVSAFISQGPKGRRGIKGAPGDRGLMGARVSELLWEADVSHPSKILWAAMSFFYCAVFLVFAMCVYMHQWLLVYDGSQGEDGVQGNGSAGCPGFQVCLDVCSLHLQSAQHHGKNVIVMFCRVTAGRMGTLASRWASFLISNLFAFIKFDNFVQFILGFYLHVFQFCSSNSFFHFCSLKSRVAKELLDPKEMMEMLESQALM